MDGTLDLPAFESATGTGFRIVGAEERLNGTVGIFHHIVAGDEIGPLEPDFIAGEETEILFLGEFLEIFSHTAPG